MPEQFKIKESGDFSISPDVKSTTFIKTNYLAILFGVICALGLFYSFLYVTGKKQYTFINPKVDNRVEKPSYPVYENPLTGELVEDDGSIQWKNFRPMGVMVNNLVPARMQSGLTKADVIYEIVAEWGITRFLAFYLSEVPEKIGPVRSTREYYLVIVKELGDAMIMHIGWSPQALEAIETWPVRSLGRGGAQFWRDQSRIDSGIAIEHTAYVDGKYLRELADSLGWEGTRDFEVYKFKNDSPVTKVADQTEENCGKTVGLCNFIEIPFWEDTDYTGYFKYDPTINSYLRFTGLNDYGKPIPHVDQESQNQLKTKNLIIQFVEEDKVEGDDKGRLEYKLIGTGDALIFIDGMVKKVTWSKSDRDSRTMYYNTDGTQFEFNRGKFWISVVPDRNFELIKY